MLAKITKNQFRKISHLTQADTRGQVEYYTSSAIRSYIQKITKNRDEGIPPSDNPRQRQILNIGKLPSRLRKTSRKITK